MTGRTALLAVAHGSRDPRHAETVRALLCRAARTRPDLALSAAFLEHGAPSLVDSLRDLRAAGYGTVSVLPLLLTTAYHAGDDLPAQLARATGDLPDLTLRRLPALAGHPVLPGVLHRRLREAGARPRPRVGVVVAAAGSTRDGAVTQVRATAQRLRPYGWQRVTAAFASAAGPTVPEAVTRLRAGGASTVVIAPYLLAPGRFSDQLADAGADLVAAPLGDAPELARAVLRRHPAYAG